MKLKNIAPKKTQEEQIESLTRQNEELIESHNTLNNLLEQYVYVSPAALTPKERDTKEKLMHMLKQDGFEHEDARLRLHGNNTLYIESAQGTLRLDHRENVLWEEPKGSTEHSSSVSFKEGFDPTMRIGTKVVHVPNEASEKAFANQEERYAQEMKKYETLKEDLRNNRNMIAKLLGMKATPSQLEPRKPQKQKPTPELFDTAERFGKRCLISLEKALEAMDQAIEVSKQ